MTKPQSFPKFSSPDLQKALEVARPDLEGVEEARNGVSRDIKELETYLQSLPLCDEFRQQIDIEPVDPDSPWIDEFECRNLKSQYRLVQQQSLVFKLYPGKPGRLEYEFRVCIGRCYEYDVFPLEGPIAIGWEPISNPFINESKPLIETKWEVRKEMFASLPGFVTALAESQRIHGVSLSHTDDEEFPF